MKKILAPSLLAANFARLEDQMKILDNSQADWIHLDVMDGLFVPNISFGMPIISAIRPYTKKPFDVHLMIQNPMLYVKEFKQVGADHLIIHYEVSNDLYRSISCIKKKNLKAGVAINPHTPIYVLEDIINEIDIVVLMSVSPGFGQQPFIENTFKKLEQLKELILKKNSPCLIEIDGGVTLENAAKLYRKGADILVAGSCIFKAPNLLSAIEKIKRI